MMSRSPRLLLFLILAGCQGTSAGGAQAGGDGGPADAAAAQGGPDGAAAMVDAPIPPPITDAAIQYQQVCSGRTGTAVPFTELALRCDGYPYPFSDLLVIDSAAQLAELATKHRCLERLAPPSFDTSRLVIVPEQGHIWWAGDVGDTVLLGVMAYQGPAPGSQGYPLVATLPKASTPVHALICAPPVTCPCPP